MSNMPNAFFSIISISYYLVYKISGSIFLNRAIPSLSPDMSDLRRAGNTYPVGYYRR